MFSAVLTEHWLSFCGLLSWILVWRFDSACGHLWGATGRSLCCQGSDPERVQASSDELWGASCGRSASSGLWPGGSRWVGTVWVAALRLTGTALGDERSFDWVLTGRTQGRRRGWDSSSFWVFCRGLATLSLRWIFSLLGESGEKCGVQFLMKAVFSEACCPVLGTMEPLPVLPASSLHWIVSVPQLDPCLEVDIQQF